MQHLLSQPREHLFFAWMEEPVPVDMKAEIWKADALAFETQHCFLHKAWHLFPCGASLDRLSFDEFVLAPLRTVRPSQDEAMPAPR